MRVVPIATLAAVAAGATVTTQSAGMLPGEVVPVLIHSPGGAFVGSAQLQTSPDGTAWTNVGTAHTSAGTSVQAITLSNYLRLNCTAFTSGSITATALNDL